MSTNSLSVLMVFALVAVMSLSGVSTATFGGGRALLGQDAIAAHGGLDPKDPALLDLAKFAVDEYNKETHVIYLLHHVSKASYKKTQQGTLYVLLLIVDDMSDLNTYRAEISVQGPEKKLILFRKIQ
ncbi:hypothetical protein CASFOL_028711 [Castilleja foliolosa]|uniref:Cysteine proteinase inhibitor n=1 Tax=Castilleja foliolosa TaxID=1961234 RepID=A0ABD3CCR5_9LAMI